MRIALSFLLTLLFASGFAQGLEENFSSSCDCWTVTNHFDNGKISSIHTENAARQKNGVAKQYNYNGQLIRQENWNNGKLDGTSTSYHHDGNLYLEAYYENGNKIGTWVFRDLDGTPTQEITYTGSAADGIYSHFKDGVKYIEQTVVDGKMVSSTILNQELFDAVEEEAAASEK